jgi:general secretion pathway protein D
VITLNYFTTSKIRPIIQPYFTSAGKVVADDQLSFIMITDYHDSIEKIKKIVTKIDTPNDLKLHWVKLENVNTKNVFPQIQALTKYIAAQYRKPIDIIEDKSSNTIIISAEGDEYKAVETMIQKIDTEAKLNINSSVITLKNSKAADLIKIIQEMEKTRYEKGDVKDGEKLSISHDESLNSIILMGEQSALNSYKSIIEDLDKPKKQVYVEAQIIEINEDKLEELGIKWDSLIGGEFNQKGGWAGNINLNSEGSPAISNFAQLAGAGKALAIPSGLTIGATLNLMASNGAGKVLSSPKLLCLDNQESTIYVGKVAPFQTADEVNNSTTTQGASYSYEEVGLTLKIKPQIMDDDKVRLDITNKLEDIIPSNDNLRPTTTKREIVTTSIVNDGDDIVIAGLIKDNISRNDSKIPLLGDLPFLGALFRSSSDKVERVNLVVILRPTVVKDVAQLPTSSMRIQDRLISKKDKTAADEAHIINPVKEELKEELKEKEEKKEIDVHEQHQKLLGGM